MFKLKQKKVSDGHPTYDVAICEDLRQMCNRVAVQSITQHCINVACESITWTQSHHRFRSVAAAQGLIIQSQARVGHDICTTLCSWSPIAVGPGVAVSSPSAFPCTMTGCAVGDLTGRDLLHCWTELRRLLLQSGRDILIQQPGTDFAWFSKR